jgi:hypothetical protein
MRRGEEPKKPSTALLAGLAGAALIALAPATASAQGYAPPPPGYEQQAQPAPQGYYVPPSVAASGPRKITDWEEGEPIPPGYHPVSRIRKGLVIGGAVLFGSMYLISVMTAAIAQDTCKATSACSNPLTPLFIPVAGPFVQLGNTGGSATAAVFLVLDGLAQAGGVAMFIAGLAAPKTVLVRNDLAKTKVHVMPVPMALGNNAPGFGFVGAF